MKHNPNTIEDRVRISRRGRDEAGDVYIKIAVDGADSVTREQWFPLSKLNNGVSPVLELIGAAGLGPLTPTQRTRVRDVLAKDRTPITTRIFTRPGWTEVDDRKIYVAPWHIVYGAEGIDIATCFSKPTKAGKWGRSGSFAVWLDLLRLIDGKNGIPVFCTSLPFAGPLLSLLGRPTAAFMLVGMNTSGKSSCVQLAGSVVGGAQRTDLGYSLSWLQTANNFDRIIYQFADGFVALDDTAQAEGQGKAVGDVLFRVVTGIPKGRYTDEGLPEEGRFSFLTSSNEFLPKILERHGQWSDPSQSVRLVEIPVERKFRAFDSVPPGMSAKELADKIKAVASEHYGHAMHRFLKKLTRDLARDPAGLISWLTARIAYIRERLQVDPNDAAQGRIAEHFAGVYAGGRLAQRYEILPWNDIDFTRAVKQRWADHRSCVAARSTKIDLIERVRAYVREHRHAFPDARKGAVAPEEWKDAKGFQTSSDGADEFSFFLEDFRGIFDSPRQETKARRMLDDAGFLVRDSDRPQVRRDIRQGRGRERVVTILASILNQ